MRLTPLDIENQKFRQSFRGYRQEEVDEFLEKLLADYASLFDENHTLAQRVAKLEAELEEYHHLKESVERSVTLAQKTADEVTHQAQSQARLIVDEAKFASERLLSEVRAKVQEASQEVTKLESKKSQFITEFKLMLETYTRLLEEGQSSTRLAETR